MKTIKTLKTVALAGLMGSALLLTGCGGGGGSTVSTPSYTPPAGYVTPDVYGNVGAPTNGTLTYRAFGNTINISKADLINIHGELKNKNVFTLEEAYNALPTSIRNQLVDQVAADSIYDASYIHENIGAISEWAVLHNGELDANGDIIEGTFNVAQEAADFANNGDGTALNPGFLGSPITAAEVSRAFSQIDEVGATEAWAQGWTGQGVTISRYLNSASETNNGSAEVVITALGIAPGLDLRNISQNTDIEVRDWNSIALNRPGSDRVIKDIDSSQPWRAGQYAGVSALVMQKFPSAPNNAVGNAVDGSEVNSNYNALKALSPTMQ